MYWHISIIPVSYTHLDVYKRQVSYAEKLKSFSTEKDAVSLLNKLPALLPIDEVFIKSDLDKTKKTTKDQEEN